MNPRSQHLLPLLGLALAAACDRAPPAVDAAAPAAQEHAESAGGPTLFGATIELGAEDRAAMGLEFARPVAATHAPEVRAWGQVVSDPAAACSVRAPFAGVLSAGDVPLALGGALAKDSVVFRLLPRWTPQELVDLAARATTARGELATAEAELPSLRTALERARTLNAQEKAVSDRELEESAARLQAAEARVAAAREMLAAVQAVPHGATDTALELRLPAAGELRALAASPGEVVEAGALLLTVEDPRTPLVLLDLPPGIGDVAAVRAARLERPDDARAFLPAERVGPAPMAGTAGLTPALLFRLHLEPNDTFVLRPGLRVTGWLDLGRPALKGVLIPRSAVVRLASQAFVYARRDEDRLERLPIALDHPLAEGWFEEDGWSAGEVPELVVRGAQNVLSFERLGRQGEEEE